MTPNLLSASLLNHIITIICFLGRRIFTSIRVGSVLLLLCMLTGASLLAQRTTLESERNASGTNDDEETVLRFNLKTFSQAVVEKNFSIRSSQLDSALLYEQYNQERAQRYPGQFTGTFNSTLVDQNGIVRGGGASTGGTTNFGLGWGTNFISGTTLSISNSNLITDPQSLGVDSSSGDNFYVSSIPIVTISQQLLGGGFIGKFNRKSLGLSLGNARAGEARFRSQAAQILLNALILYHQFLVNDELIALYKEDLKETRDTLRFNANKSRLGVLRERDLVSSEIVTVEVESLLLEAERQSKQLLNNLVTIIGESPGSRYRLELEDGIVIEEPQTNLKVALDEAFNERQDYREARLALDTARASISVAKLSKLPTLEVGLTTGFFGSGNTLVESYNDISFTGGDRFNLTIFAQLNAFTGRKWYRAATASSELQVTQSEVNLNRVRQNIEESLQNILISLETNYEILEKNERVLGLTKQKFDFYRRDYRNGNVDFEESVRVRRELIGVELRYLNSRLAYEIDFLNYLYLTGRLNREYYDITNLTEEDLN